MADGGIPPPGELDANLSAPLRSARSAGPQNRELVRDLEALRAEPVERGRPAARAARLSPLARRREHAPAEEHALEVRRRDVVPERGDVDLAQLRQREARRGEREARVRVRELRAQPVAAGERDRAVIEG